LGPFCWSCFQLRHPPLTPTALAAIAGIAAPRTPEAMCAATPAIAQAAQTISIALPGKPRRDRGSRQRLAKLTRTPPRASKPVSHLRMPGPAQLPTRSRATSPRTPVSYASTIRQAGPSTARRNLSGAMPPAKRLGRTGAGPRKDSRAWPFAYFPSVVFRRNASRTPARFSRSVTMGSWRSR
jgi:hypothetical protein